MAASRSSPCSRNWLAKSNGRIEFLISMPTRATKPIIAVNDIVSPPTSSAVLLDPRELADLEAMRSAIVGPVGRFLEALYTAMPRRERASVARLAVLVVQHVLDDARIAPRDLQAGMPRDLQRMLVRYFAAFGQRYGVPAARGARSARGVRSGRQPGSTGRSRASRTSGSA